MSDIPAPQKILVTGAAGFIGSHTVDLLIRHGHEVLGIDDLSTGSLENIIDALASGRFSLEQRDMLEPEAISDLIRGFQPDAVIHLAGLVSVTLGQTQPERNFRLNVESTKIVAEAAREFGCPRVVFASSAAVYGDLEKLPVEEDDQKDPISNYGTAKLLSEMLLQSYAKSYDMTCVSNRFFNVFGPRQDPHSPYSGVISIFAERYANGEQATIFGDGSQSRDFVSVYDIAHGNLLAATKPNIPSGSYNLCTNEQKSLLDLAEVLAVNFPDAPAVEFAEERSGDIKHSLGSNAKAREHLGFNPRMSFADGVAGLVKSLGRRTVEHLVERAA